MWSQRRRILSQNFFHNRKLVQSLVRQSSIGKQDTVIEIGPGTGVITQELINTAGFVIAVEIDTRLTHLLTEKFSIHPNFKLIMQDFMQYKLPGYPYKIFANIPFSIEGKIIRKLLNAPQPPKDSYLVMRRDLAIRLSGVKSHSQFSMVYKPWFQFEIIHYFHKQDFQPYARMDTVMLRCTQRPQPLLEVKHKQHYAQFISQGFGGGRDIKHNLRIFFTHEQLKRLSLQLRFKVNDNPTQLTVVQWLALFRYWLLSNKTR